MDDAVIQFEVDGDQVEVPDDGASLLGTLRDRLGKRSAKDGCSPQGQCGCCTVLVDGQPRVACVTPTRRVRGRSVVTLDGFSDEERMRWGRAFCNAGASQCGFCTPGIIVRLAGLEAKKPDAGRVEVDKALAAHLCRCTGWQTIHEAWNARHAATAAMGDDAATDAASRRATIEGRAEQRVDIAVALGGGGFADDTAPEDALVAVRASDGAWHVAATTHEARQSAGKVQGRRTTLDVRYPIELPSGDWAATLQTTWTEPGYLETDAAWAAPGQPAVSALANGGAFGAKVDSAIGSVAEQLANEHGRPVRALFSREDAVRFGPKRPPVAGGVRPDGTGVLRVAATAGLADVVRRFAPTLEVVEVELTDELSTSASIRGAGWVEALCLLALGRGAAERVELPDGGWAEADVDDDRIRVVVGAGAALDETVLRSYAIGAAHMATSLVRSEALTVDSDGIVQDLTVRSFGIMKAADMPRVDVKIVDDGGPSVNGSDAVFAAVASATCVRLRAERWPTG